MRVLITGVAGFIGTNLSLHYLEKRHKDYCIDNFDKYNSLVLKKFRLRILKIQKNLYSFH